MTTTRSQRRTQAERRAATRQALLEATIDCLCEHGYPNLTGAQISARAGVTRGAQAYYFTTKVELVIAALEYAMERMITSFRTDPPRLETESATAMALVDRVWALHESPAFTAAAEVAFAARTDEELREKVGTLNRRLVSALTELVQQQLPGLSEHGEAYAVMLTALAAVRGVLVMGVVSDAQTIESLWLTVRGQLEKLISTM
ncbi:TetR/AcrR family transcriptional regulator [Kutzneria albida]|uniref:HTH tetR-type domain-containing protein n=1 Tax=Kutzneria albida DSM 43870 TaxID=1449976 RepID=W5W3V1_9PSEU|nr:TetR/AcrR family transcriptional regulator [Kutzneria albida]AHH95527.1 hypothetical protein KALB_2158 [Kutzneria albida DSM 43870]